jgi:hypothetical protein
MAFSVTMPRRPEAAARQVGRKISDQSSFVVAWLAEFASARGISQVSAIGEDGPREREAARQRASNQTSG